MAKCPVCETEYIEEQVQFCSICAWDLNPYPLTFQLPEAFVEKEKTKLAWAKQMWRRYLEQAEKLERSQNELLQPAKPHTTIQAQSFQFLEKNSIQVYEFSIEFLDVSFKNGKWVSGGFGAELGKSNKDVPKKIQDAVNRGDFRINYYYPPKQQDYALIAREIDEYSVLAVATREEDDKTRIVIAYRYFWLQKPAHQDIDGIGTLLIWWMNSGEPKFDFEWTPNSRTLNYTAQYYSREVSYQYFERYSSFVQNILPQIKQYPFVYQFNEVDSRNALHYLALYLNKEYDTPISWAWNVGWLEYPQNFTLICSDEKSHQHNFSSIKKYQKLSRKASAQIWHQIRLCLLDIARSDEKTNKKFEELMLYLEEYPISNWEWVKILDNNTTKNNVNIIGATYRALLTILGNIPVTEWLETLDKESSDKNKIAALNIQKSLVEISSKRDNDTVYQHLTKHLKIGIIEILLQCQSKIDNSIYQNIEWLLSESNSVWIEYFNNYAKTLVSRLLHQDKNGDDQFYQQLLTKLNDREKYQQRFGHYRVLPQYKNLAHLFARLGHYSLSAFFYQLSSGRVPADIYERGEVTIIPTIRDEKSSGLTKNTKNWFQLF